MAIETNYMQSKKRQPVPCPHCDTEFIPVDHRQQYCTKRCTSMARYAAHKQWMWDRKDEPCEDCGVRYQPWQMDFDHLPGEEKLFEIGQGLGRTRESLSAEIAKCDLVCANCHRDRTYQRTH